MSLLTARMREALEKRRPLILLAEIDHPDGVVNVWSRQGDLSYDGKIWKGLGMLGRISPMGTTATLSIREVVFNLGGVPAESLAFIDANIRNRIAQVWIGAMEKKRKVIADPIQIMEARLDYQDYSIDDNLMATVKLHGQIGFWTLERAVDIVWSPEEHKRDFPTDTGLDLVSSLANKEVVWRLTDAS